MQHTVMNSGTKSKARRIPALDFAKGVLILLIVLYHWLNYFIVAEFDFYRYLRFLTPSFIFITGFIVSNVYLSKYEVLDSRIPRRLTQRGLKLLGIFILLNVIIALLFRESSTGPALYEFFSPKNLSAVFVTGNVSVAGLSRGAAFYILVPISYLLLLSAALLVVHRFYLYIFHTMWVVSLLAIYLLSSAGQVNTNLELVTIGLLGVISGSIPIERIERNLHHPYLLVCAYFCYVIAISIWNVVYPLQIVGVCLSLMLIYFIGTKGRESGAVTGRIILLGQYSLLGYIAQIAVLQVLRRGVRHIELGFGVLAITLVAAFALTMIIVEMTDRARTKVEVVDRCYKAVFS
jgi:peptidoglycan/LPS O-acetylase OafA/YrhL